MMLMLILRVLFQNLHWILLVLAPYFLAAGCQSSENSNSNNSNINSVNDNVSGTADSDGDGIVDAEDNCPDVSNPVQGDVDEDGIGNSCDNCVDDANDDQADGDGDEVGDVCDNCPEDANEDQADSDDDGTGDVCEPPSGTLSGRIVPLAEETPMSRRRDGRKVATFGGRRPALVAGELLVVYEAGMRLPQRRALEAQRGLTLISASSSGLHRYRYSQAPCARTSQKEYLALLHKARMLRKHRDVRSAEPNAWRYPMRVPNDEFYENQQWHYEAIGLPEAWDITVGDETVIVALVDTGVVLDHPDFEGRLVDGYDFISDSQTANDGDGGEFTDDNDDGEDDSDIDDNPDDPGDNPPGSSFHGTHTAGTVGAATDNELGVAGVTWDCKIMPLRGLGFNGGSVADIVEAMLFAGGLVNASGTVPENPARVLNLSLGGVAGEAESAVERQVIQDLNDVGVTVVAAAGNQSSSAPAPPAFYPETISVGAVAPDLSLASYSNFGSTVDLVAPGGSILDDGDGDGVGGDGGVFSTVADDSSGEIESDFTFFEGTSMACPHVAGVAALMLSVNPDLTPAEIRQILIQTSADLGEEGKDEVFGYGLLDAGAAVSAAQTGEVPDVPEISLSTTDLDFGILDDELEITVTNVGGGILNVLDAVDDEVSGGNWLSVETSGSDASANVTSLLIQVDRSGLDPGSYTGTVTIQASDQADQVVLVQMEVLEVTFTGTIVVEAIDADTMEVVDTVQTSDAEDFTYTFEDLPVGTYILMAGTDADEDGEICEADDLCGSFEDDVTVTSGDTASNVNFIISAGGG